MCTYNLRNSSITIKYMRFKEYTFFFHIKNSKTNQLLFKL